MLAPGILTPFSGPHELDVNAHDCILKYRNENEIIFEHVVIFIEN